MRWLMKTMWLRNRVAGVLLTALLFTLLVPYSGMAADMESLLQAKVAVSSQTRGERDRATRAGFSEVLVRVAGHEDVVRREQIREAIQRANDYIIQYSYSTEQGQRYLNVSFNEERTLALLQRARASIWSARRPELMVWIAQATPSGLQLVGRDSNSDFLQALSSQARQRGLPIASPLLDLTDRMALSANDVWGRFESPVLAATSRYPANGAVMVRYSQVDEQRRAEWTLLIGRFEVSGTTTADNEEALGVALGNALTEAVAAEYAVSFAQSDMRYVSVRLLNLHELEQILAAESLLKRLGPVMHVSMTRYHQGVADFTLYVAGDEQRVAQALELERTVQRIEDPWSNRGRDLLEYRWLR